MKKWLFFLSLTSLLFSQPIEERAIAPEALSELTSGLGIPEHADVVEETQRRWLRKPGQERWEIEELSAQQRAFVLDWAKREHFFEAWAPTRRHYDKALILGATTGRMETRLAYLVKLWNEGVRFDEIVWLTGDRPLDSRVDGMTDRCKNESEASRLIWAEAELPGDFRALPVVYVAVPMKEGGKRPNTEDTIIAWLNTSPKPCSGLFISDQPFCGYQFAIVNECLPKDFDFDVVGEGVDSPEHPAAAAITLDSIARWLYAERKGKS